jgi:asparagine synthase (glutamine-hydrolysing)
MYLKSGGFMCGIAGVFKKHASKDVEKMIKIIQHRGPDGQGIRQLPNGVLGHTRLAIIDIDGGSQPMSSNGSCIAFNGEIYNYRELTKKYLADFPLITRSDTEVVLQLYRKLGNECVNLFRGMYAFAIIKNDELFLARDPIGIKPLYYGEKDGGLYFASEIKALAQITDDIHEFPAGHWYHSKKGFHPFFQVNSDTLDIQDEHQATGAIRETLTEAVRLRMIADVPVGISLSGGLDSSIIAMLANHETSHLHSFAVGMEGSEDLKAAQMMADRLGTNHHQYIYTEEDMIRALPKVIYHLESFDPALVRSAIPNFFLAELAKKTVKVILSGEGADEIYAGYDYMNVMDDPQALQHEMIHITSALHNTNLQRADRVSMAFGLEARVPFLDTRSIKLGLGLPAKWKIHKNRPAKFLLRRTFKNDLPKFIVDRPKQKFSKGAGSSDVIAQKVETEISNSDFQNESARLLSRWNYRLPNKESLFYYRILHQQYKDQWIFPNMGSSRSL